MTASLLNAARMARVRADEAKAALDAIQERYEASIEHCFPGPAWRDVERARMTWQAAEADADAALKLARGKDA